MNIDIFLRANNNESVKDTSYLNKLLFKCSDKDITLYVDLWMLFGKIPYIYNMIYNLGETSIEEEDFTSDIIRKLIYCMHGSPIDITGNMILLMDKWCMDIYQYIEASQVYNMVMNGDKDIVNYFEIKEIYNEYKNTKDYKLILKDKYLKFVRFLYEIYGLSISKNMVQIAINDCQIEILTFFIEHMKNTKSNNSYYLNNASFDHVCMITMIYQNIGYDITDKYIQFFIENMTLETISKLLRYLKENRSEEIFNKMVRDLCICNIYTTFESNGLKNKDIYVVIFDDHIDSLRSFTNKEINDIFSVLINGRWLPFFSRLYDLFYDKCNIKYKTNNPVIPMYVSLHDKSSQSNIDQALTIINNSMTYKIYEKLNNLKQKYPLLYYKIMHDNVTNVMYYLDTINNPPNIDFALKFIRKFQSN